MPFIQDPNVNSPVIPVRELHDDESFVLNEYERHAGHCSRCVDALEVHRDRRSLCDRGQQYAADVASYIYSKRGKAYSTVDRRFAQQTLIRIPKDNIASRRLLLAVEEGLRVRRKDDIKRPVVTQELPPHVAVYRRPATSPEPGTQIIERPVHTTRRRVIVYPRGSPSRGSLYEADAAARVERRGEIFKVHRPRDHSR